MSPDCPPPNVVHRSNASHTVTTNHNAFSAKSIKSKGTKKINNKPVKLSLKLIYNLCFLDARSSSPKITRHTAVSSALTNNTINNSKKHTADKSPILNHSRKSHQAMTTSMRINSEIQSKQLQQQKVLANINNSLMQTSPPDNSCTVSSDEDDSDHINVDKLKTIRNKAAQR